METVPVEELFGWLKHKLNLPKRDLAKLIGVDRDTLTRWERTGEVDFGACRLLLQLLGSNLDFILPLLLERKNSDRRRAPWPERVKALRAAFHLTVDDFSDLLMTNPGSVVNWEQGHTDPMSCQKVLLDLFEDHPDQMAKMLGFVPVGEGEEESDWPRERIEAALSNAGLENTEFAELAGIESQSVTAWLRGTSVPSACSAFFLRAVEKLPQVAIRMMKRADRGEWESGRAAGAREKAGLSANELERLTGISSRTLRGWEEEMPWKMDCAKVLYSMIEHDPKAFVSFARRIAD